MGLNTCSNVFLVLECVIMCTRHKHSRSVMLGYECMFWVWSECVSLSELVSDMSHMQECALNVNLYSGVSTCTCRSIFLLCDTRWVCSWISSRGQFLEVVWRQVEKSQTMNYGKGIWGWYQPLPGQVWISPFIISKVLPVHLLRPPWETWLTKSQG